MKSQLAELEVKLQNLLIEIRIEGKRLEGEWHDMENRRPTSGSEERWNFTNELIHRYQGTKIQPLLDVIRILNRQIDQLEGIVSIIGCDYYENGAGI